LASSDELSLTAAQGNSALARSLPGDRPSVETQKISCHGLACVNVSGEIAVNPTRKNIALSWPGIMEVNALIDGSAYICEDTISSCKMDVTGVLQKLAEL